MSEHWANKKCMKIRRVCLLATEGVYLYLLHLCANNNTDVSLIVLVSPSEDDGCDVHSLHTNKNVNNTSEVKKNHLHTDSMMAGFN